MNSQNQRSIEEQLTRLADRIGVSAERVEQLHAKYDDWQRRFSQHPLFVQLHAKVTAAWRFLQNPKVPKKDKALVLAAIGYVVMPLDVIPDWMPLVGLVDDMVAMGLALSVVSRHTVSTANDSGQRGQEVVPADDETDHDDDDLPADGPTTSN